GGDDDAAGALTVGSAGDVVSSGGGLEGGYGFDSDGRFRQKSEQLGQFRFHLGDVVTVVVEDLLGRGGNVFGIGFEGFAERGEIGEAFFFGDHGHLGLDTIHLTKADLVNLIRGQAGGGAGVDIVLVTLLAVREGSNGKRGAACGRVLGAQKIGESVVGGDDVGIDGGGDLLGQALLIFRGDAR